MTLTTTSGLGTGLETISGQLFEMVDWKNRGIEMGNKSKVRQYVHIFKDKKTGVTKKITKKKLGAFGGTK